MHNPQQDSTAAEPRSYRSLGIGSATVANSAPPSSPSVIEQLNYQEQAIMGAHNALDGLIDRLLPILGPTSQISRDTAPAPPTPSQISARVPLHTRSIEALIARLQEVQGRVEL